MAIKIFTFTVSGYGTFPADMLRYDCCWPKSGEDVSKIFGDVERVPERPQEITLKSSSEPTVARWESFGWIVKGIRRG